MLIVATLGALAVSLSLRLLRDNTHQEAKLPIKHKDTRPEEFDPFGDQAWTEIPDSGAEQIRVTTTHVEVGSTTEELSFDWIASPFHLEDNVETPQSGE